MNNLSFISHGFYLKKIIFSTIFLGLTSLYTFGQVDWLFLQGGIYDDEGRGIVIDSKGYIYIIGTFKNSADFNPGPAVDSYQTIPTNRDNGFIQKFHPNQSLMWVKQFGLGGGVSVISDVIIDEHDNIYISGGFTGNPDFDTDGLGYNLLAPSSSDGFVAKYDDEGSIIWAKGLSGYDIQRVSGIALDNNDNLYITGLFYSEIDLDPNAGVALETEGITTGFQEPNGFIAKWDIDGHFIWGGSYKSISCIGSNVEVDENDNVYLTGSFRGSLDIDITADSEIHDRTRSTGFIVKMDSSKVLLWGKVLSGTDNGSQTHGTGLGPMAIDFEGSLFIGGGFVGEVFLGYGDPNYNFTGNSFYPDCFIQKINADGIHEWTKVFGGNYSESVSDLKTSDDGQLYTTGTFSSYVQFNSDDPASAVTSQSQDIYTMSWNIDGSFNWIQTFGGTCDYSTSAAIAHDGNQNVYGTGMFDGSLEPSEGQYIFGPGSNDCIVYKIAGQLDIAENQLSEVFSLYPNPTIELLNIGLLTNSNPDKIELIDLTGRTVFSKDYRNQISIDSIENGTYLFRLWDNQQLIGEKMVIISNEK